MKLISIFFLFALSFSAFSAEVLTCQLSPSKRVNITKENNRYFYTINKMNKAPLVKAATLAGAEINKDETILEVMQMIGIKTSDLSRINFYKLTDNADGGVSLLRFITKDNQFLIVSVSMGGVNHCQ